MKKYNVGILGCGEISDIYFQTCETFEIMQIKACASRNIEKAKKKAAEYNISKACKERASSEMAYHSLEAMTGIVRSSVLGEFYTLKSTCSKPSPMPKDFPLSEERSETILR
ncbi:hypothetical protein R4Z09_18015 [Niallia oryzisoli]|uniref:Gfo/Idh/MocA-like oxidoreductase N-terminal domain-containing protein n=1 Tax=Niallia oryzisoli TaxID=1737571 RepID=A0ABZ2C9T3_9BACI